MQQRITKGQNANRNMVQRARELRGEMTEAEGRLWERLRNHRLDGLSFRRQQILGHYVVDFCCLRARLVVEVDGSIHDRRQAQDEKRDRDLARMEFTVLRVRNRQVFSRMERILRRIAAMCIERML